MRRFALLTLSLMFAAAGCGGSGQDTVSMTDARRFDPDVITISVGERIVWKNESSEPHTVTAYEASLPDPGAYFSSTGDPPLSAARKGPEEWARAMVADGLVAPGETYGVRFDVAGTYEYFCIPHEDQGMKGKIIVEGG